MITYAVTIYTPAPAGPRTSTGGVLFNPNRDKYESCTACATLFSALALIEKAVNEGKIATVETFVDPD